MRGMLQVVEPWCRAAVEASERMSAVAQTGGGAGGGGGGGGADMQVATSLHLHPKPAAAVRLVQMYPAKRLPSTLPLAGGLS